MLIKITYIALIIYLKFPTSFTTFEDEYPGTIICQHDYLQQETVPHPSKLFDAIKALKKTKCTHIQGSLYIRGLTPLPENSSELYLDSLIEIDGHLIIEGNDFQKISLKNLKIIRGLTTRLRQVVKSSSLNVTFEVIGNPKLVELDLSSLRSINQHNIVFLNNPNLRYLPHRINWTELFTNKLIQKCIAPSINLDIFERDKCSESCNKWLNANQSFCWGPANNMCQKKVLCENIYSDQCESCFYKDGKEVGCCNDQCIGGCTGMGQTKCTACKAMLNGNKCTDSCPSRYSSGILGSTQNKDFKYYTGSFCSKSCPKIMLPEETTCVHRCSDDYFKNESNYCVKCYGNKCQNEDIPCDLMKMLADEQRHDHVLTATVLKKLTNCKKIRGYFILTSKSFKTFGVTVQMLYDHLSKLEDLEGGFTYFKDDNLKNLTFLKNLKTFRAALMFVGKISSASYHRFSIYNTTIEFLGFKSLKKIDGDLGIKNNPRLCYLDLPWKSFVIGKLMIQPKNAYCSEKKCHTECSDEGCWGPENQLCFKCRNFNANGTCVSDCSIEKGFYFPKNGKPENKTCLKCDIECRKTCDGPGPHECLKGCLNKRENSVCVAKCSNKYYSDEIDIKLCKSCNVNCTIYDGPICTGNSSVLGKGGCNKCSRILLDRKGNIRHCVQECPVGTFTKTNDLPEIKKYYPGSHGFTCFPCHPLCSSCRGKSDTKDDCELCTGYWYKENCKSVCPKDDYYNITINKNNKKTCKTCHYSCAGGCTGGKAVDCKRCKGKKIYYNITKKLFYCNKTCPLGKEVTEIESDTGDSICLSFYESKAKLEEIKRTKITVAVVLAMLFLVIFVIIIIVICLRKKALSERMEAELKARYSNLTEPNSKDEDLLNKPPNMGRLVIVSKEDLAIEDQTRPLGFGAFGYVYKGKWKIPKDEDTLLRKATGDFYLPVAIKVIKNMGSEEVDTVMQEAKMMASVSHMHCLRFIGICLSYDKPYLISAYVKEGSLDKYLVRNKSKINSLVMLSWAEQIADGMLYLTKRNIIHRDLAARNVLVNRLECVQITDFGLAKMLESTKDKEIIIKTGKVPIRWLAIETLTEGKYSHETDVWAYGITLWEIFTFGKVPYEDQATLDIFDFVLKGGRLSQPDICSLDVYILMVNCWLESPNLRPDFQNLMKTFVDYSKNPGRYLSIQGDPYEIPSPNNIEMTNLNNPYYADHFNFSPSTAETVLPLLNNREDHDTKNFTQVDDEMNDLLLSASEKETLPTRSINRTSNPFKRFQENRQPSNLTNTRNNTNTPRLVSLASQEEVIFRNQPSVNDDDPRYVSDPTDRTIKIRQQPFKSHLLSETPRFLSNASRQTSHSTKSQSPKISVDVDGYLEPITKSDSNQMDGSSFDTEGYLEPLNSPNRFSSDEYMVPSQPSTPRESLFNNKSAKNSNAFNLSKNFITVNDQNKSRNTNLSTAFDDDGYLEPESSSRLLNSSNR